MLVSAVLSQDEVLGSQFGEAKLRLTEGLTDLVQSI